MTSHPTTCPSCGEHVSPFPAGCALCGATLDPRRAQGPLTLSQRLGGAWRVRARGLPRIPWPMRRR